MADLAARTAMGVAILAFSSPAVRRRALGASAVARRPLDPDRFEAALAEVRRHRVVLQTGHAGERWSAAAARAIARAYLGPDD